MDYLRVVVSCIVVDITVVKLEVVCCWYVYVVVLGEVGRADIDVDGLVTAATVLVGVELVDVVLADCVVRSVELTLFVLADELDGKELWAVEVVGGEVC